MQSLPAAAAAEREYEAISPELVLVDPELARRARRASTLSPRSVSPSASTAPSRRRPRRLLAAATISIIGCVAGTAAWLAPAAPERRVAATPKAMSAPSPVGEPLRFTWAPVPEAHSYRLVLYRGGARIYETVTPLPERTLPLRWTFRGATFRLTRGTYRWVVTPRLGRSPPFREGNPIVDASYTA